MVNNILVMLGRASQILSANILSHSTIIQFIKKLLFFPCSIGVIPCTLSNPHDNLSSHAFYLSNRKHKLCRFKNLVLCIQPGLVICFTIDNIHVSMLFSWNIPPSPSPTESKRLFYKSVSFFFYVLHIGLSLTSF